MGAMHCGEERAARLRGCRQEGRYLDSVANCRPLPPGGLRAFLAGSGSVTHRRSARALCSGPRVEESPRPLGKHPEVKHQRVALPQRQVIKTVKRGPCFEYAKSPGVFVQNAAAFPDPHS